MESHHKENRGEYDKCFVSKCKNCKELLAKIESIAVNHLQEDTVVNLCETYAVENTTRGEKVMILDPGVPITLAGRPWLEKCLAEFDHTITNLVSSECHQVFLFGGIDKRHVSTKLIELPLLVRSRNGKEYILKVMVYVIETDVESCVEMRLLSIREQT